jgi:hypothetical protein
VINRAPTGRTMRRGLRREREVVGRRTLGSYAREPVSHIDLPAGDVFEGWRAERLARSEIERGVVPRAANRALGNDSFRKRSAVMGTGRAHGEHFAAGAHHHDGLTVRVAK